METVSSWAGSPKVTLVSEGGSQVKVHRLLLGLNSDQWRLTLQGLEISQLVFILQGVDGLQLGRLVGEIYEPFAELVSEEENTVERVSVITRVEREREDESDQSNDNIDDEDTNYGSEDKNESEVIITDEVEGDYPTEVRSPDMEEIIEEEVEGDVSNKDDSPTEAGSQDMTSISPDSRIESTKIEKHEGIWYYCHLCDFRAERKANLKIHIQSWHLSAEFQCGQCGAVYNSKSAMNLHRKIKHEGFIPRVIMYPCNQCDYQAKGKTHLRRHIESKHEGIKRFPCHLCDFRAVQEKNLKSHIKTRHLGIKIYNPTECPECGEMFTTKGAMTVHFKSIHQGVKYPCDLCDYQATQPSNLKAHIQKRHEGIRYPCDQCDYQAKTKTCLQRHIESQHEGVRYTCNQCDKQFTSQNTLRTHMLKHQIRKEMRYFCDQCGHQAKTEKSLQEHIQSKHEGFKYPCNQCDYQATTQRSLRKHVLFKHGD